MKVIFRLKGGLGNQLFIVSYGIIIENLTGCRPLYDISLFRLKSGSKKFTHRDLDINKILLNGLTEWRPFFGYFNFSSRLSKFIAIFLGYKYYSNEEEIYELRRRKIYLDNYYQASQLILDSKEFILQKFYLGKDLLRNSKSLNYLEDITHSQNPVCIHVRRGDYLNSENKKIFNNLGVNYFLRAYDFLQRNYACLTPFVFSDDIEFCKKKINISNAVFVQNTLPFEDLLLMSRCKFHIISNSTFSWWGAFLSAKSVKVIVPKVWYLPGRSENIIIPSSWHIFE